MPPTLRPPTLPFPLPLILLLLLPAIAHAQLPGTGTGAPGAGSIADLQQGIRLLRTGENAAAKSHFAAMAERDPDSAMPRYYLALANAALGAGGECITALSAAAERGWPRPEALGEDAAFSALREKDEEFRRALDALAAAWRARSEQGLLPGHALPAARWIDDAGKEHPLVERGRPTAILFVRAGEPEDITALWALEAEIAGRGAEVRSLVLVECPEKEEGERRERLARFRSEMNTALPCGLATEELRRSLRPFRVWPTLLGVDAEGRAVRAVEGLPPDLGARYAALLGAKAKPAAEDERDAPPETPKEAPPPPPKETPAPRPGETG